MSWTAPQTRATGYVVLDTDYNDQIITNLLYLYAAVMGAFFADRQATAISATATSRLVAVTNTAAPRTITLPTSMATTAGVLVCVKDESGAASVNSITIQGQAGELIDGQASAIIDTNYGLIGVYSDGAAWHVAFQFGGIAP